MGNRIMLTKSIFEWLIEHLVFIEESADELVNFYYPDLPVEQCNMKRFFTEYIKKIEAELEQVEIVSSIDKFRYANSLNEFSFVIIGSQVELLNLTSRRNVSFKIIHPDDHNKRSNEITYLSALGKALLLKEVGNKVEVNMPAGLQRYKIEAIKL